MNRSNLAIGECHLRRGRPLARRRATKGRFKTVWLKGVLIMLCLALAAAGGRWLVTTPLFSITKVESGPYRYTSPQELEALLGTALGKNVWSFAAVEFAQEVQALPWVQEVRVIKRLPTTLKIQLQEWRPLLTVVPAPTEQSSFNSILVLRGDGTIVPFPEDLPAPSLPVLVGAKLKPLTGGHWQLANPKPVAVLDLAAAITETALEAFCPIDFIQVRDDGFAIVLQGGQGSLLVGNEDFSRRLHRFMVGKDEVTGETEVDLRFHNRLAARGQDKRV